jgi:hypothetical protein
MGEMRYAYRVLAGKTKGRRSLRRHIHMRIILK